MLPLDHARTPTAALAHGVSLTTPLQEVSPRQVRPRRDPRWVASKIINWMDDVHGTSGDEEDAATTSTAARAPSTAARTPFTAARIPSTAARAPTATSTSSHS